MDEVTSQTDKWSLDAEWMTRAEFAEMVGVKSGIGFYLQWAQGWAAYPNMYAALLVMALLCSGLISGLFMVRDRLLSWQRGGMQW